jgi:hypothetical protein
MTSKFRTHGESAFGSEVLEVESAVLNCRRRHDSGWTNKKSKRLQGDFHISKKTRLVALWKNRIFNGNTEYF